MIVVIITVIIVLLLVTMFRYRKNIANLLKYILKNKIVMTFLIVLIAFVVIMSYIKNNPQQVDKNLRIMVENYLEQNYNYKGKIIASWDYCDLLPPLGQYRGCFWVPHYSYEFKFLEKNGKVKRVHYYSTENDLMEETLYLIEIEEKTLLNF